MTPKSKQPAAVRCAIYTRKSTEEGLEQEFNSLDAQREAGEAYIKSQQHEGWVCLPEYYDDGGFTGGNLERPAIRRLLFDTLKQRGVDSVSGLHQSRKVDFRKGKRLDKEDHIVRWRRPATRSLTGWAHRELPEYLTVRECRIHIEQAGFRSKAIVVVTTLLDPEEFTKEDLAGLYRARWNAELDLRSVKQTLQMDILRCKTPELVRKEIWTHILAYNLIRTIMAQAATRHDIQPRAISFKGTLQLLGEFQRLIDYQEHRGVAHRMILYESMLDSVASQRVADRPDRFEPRLIKRRHGKYDLLTKPRCETKQLIAKGLK